MIVGIDPGVSGAIVAVAAGGIVHVADMPTTKINGRDHIDEYGVKVTLQAFSRCEECTVIIEHVQGVQQSGATSAFNFGAGWGLVRGVTCGLGLPSMLVRPQRWTKDLAVGRDKNEHVAMACRLWPASADVFARVGRGGKIVHEHGRADAALIAEWFRRQGINGKAAGVAPDRRSAG
jgi:crossover junction endodeoxyribonuclease RuvC